MKFTLRDLIKITLAFIASATPTLAQINFSQEVSYRNPFLPNDRSVQITPLISWSPTIRESSRTSAESSLNINSIPRRLPTVEEGCGRRYIRPAAYVEGGTPARNHDWPFIALLGYGEGSYTKFMCGGTLITARHVITAAHCIRDDLAFVRLGEHDLSTDTDTVHEDINIVKVARHPQYSTRNGRSDIAILYLERNVEFTTTILPICMPTFFSLRSKSYVDSNATIAGWGRLKEGGETATVLNELKIPVLENEICRSSYARVNRHFTDDQFDEAVVCAGFLTGGKDSCNGDSGGPLIISEDVTDEYPKERYFLIGIVAYGVGCARPGIPGVYTSTQYFIDWIQEKLQDTP